MVMNAFSCNKVSDNLCLMKMGFRPLATKSFSLSLWNFVSALRLGLPFVPSFLGQTGRVEDMLHGLNFASAGAGIIFTSGSELVCLNFSFFDC